MPAATSEVVTCQNAPVDFDLAEHGPQHQQSTNQHWYFNIKSRRYFLNQIKLTDNKKKAKKDIRNTADYASFRYV